MKKLLIVLVAIWAGWRVWRWLFEREEYVMCDAGRQG